MAAVRSQPFALPVDFLRLGEFDIGGVLYHAHYFHLYEMAREALLRAIGQPYPGIVAAECHLAVVRSEQDFHAPIYYGHPIEVRIWAAELSRTSVTFRYEITDPLAKRNPIHEASTSHVFVRKTDGSFRPAPLPADLANGLQKYVVSNV